jgi:hypothetical protein
VYRTCEQNLNFLHRQYWTCFQEFHVAFIKVERALPSLMMLWVFVVNTCETYRVHKCFRSLWWKAQDDYRPLKKWKNLFGSSSFSVPFCRLLYIKRSCLIGVESMFFAQNQCTHLAMLL